LPHPVGDQLNRCTLQATLRSQSDFYFRLAEVINVRPEENYIETSIGGVKYDYLVIAPVRPPISWHEGRGKECLIDEINR